MHSLIIYDMSFSIQGTQAWVALQMISTTWSWEFSRNLQACKLSHGTFIPFIFGSSFSTMDAEFIMKAWVDLLSLFLVRFLACIHLFGLLFMIPRCKLTKHSMHCIKFKSFVWSYHRNIFFFLMNSLKLDMAYIYLYISRACIPAVKH